MADVRVLHNGNTIAELSETGTKTAVTGGRYCKGDLEIDYTKPYGDPPSGIRITALPGKTHFRKGERIDYTGICVRAVRPDGTTFTDETYPDGRIPFAELVFPVETAQTGHVGDVYTTPSDDSSGVYRKSGEVFSFQPIPVGTVIRTAASPIFDRTYTLTSAGAPVYACRTIIPNDYSYVTLSSAKTFVLHYRGKDGTGSSSDPYREHDETRTSIRLQCDRDGNLWLVQAPTAVYYNQSEAVADMNRFGAGIPIPVRWSSPYTGAVLEDTFIINGETPDPTLTITQNGTHDVYDYSFAQVNVQPVLQSKTATKNGTVTPDTGYDGLSSVEVDVVDAVSIASIKGLNGTSYARLSNNASDRVTRVDRYFQRSTNEPVIFIPASASGGKYTGYGCIMFSNAAPAGTYSSYGQLDYVTQHSTSSGTVYYTALMGGMYPPSESSNRLVLKIDGIESTMVMSNAPVHYEKTTAAFVGDAQTIQELERYIDRVYEVYYA